MPPVSPYSKESIGTKHPLSSENPIFLADDVVLGIVVFALYFGFWCSRVPLLAQNAVVLFRPLSRVNTACNFFSGFVDFLMTTETGLLIYFNNDNNKKKT
jgi:hypothetical protein